MSEKGNICQHLSAYLDGELAPAEADRVTRALEADAEIRRELDDLANVRAILRSLPRERAGENFIPCVLAEAERAQLVGVHAAEDAPGALRWIRYMATAAVLLVAATIGVVIAATLWSPPRPDFETTVSQRPSTTTHEPAKEALKDGETDRLRGRASVDALASLGKDSGLTSETMPAGKGGEVERLFGKAKELAKGAGDLESALALAPESNQVIFTDRMDFTQRQIEKVLVSNGIAPVVANEPAPARTRLAARGNFYNQTRQAADQVQYEVFVTPEQMSRVQRELSSLRASQNVSQSLALADAGDRLDRARTTAGVATKLEGAAAPGGEPAGGAFKFAETAGTEERERGGLQNSKLGMKVARDKADEQVAIAAAEAPSDDIPSPTVAAPAEEAPAAPKARTPAAKPAPAPAPAPPTTPAPVAPARPMGKRQPEVDSKGIAGRDLDEDLAKKDLADEGGHEALGRLGRSSGAAAAAPTDRDVSQVAQADRKAGEKSAVAGPAPEPAAKPATIAQPAPRPVAKAPAEAAAPEARATPEPPTGASAGAVAQARKQSESQSGGGRGIIEGYALRRGGALAESREAGQDAQHVVPSDPTTKPVSAPDRAERRAKDGIASLIPQSEPLLGPAGGRQTAALPAVRPTQAPAASTGEPVVEMKMLSGREVLDSAQAGQQKLAPGQVAAQAITAPAAPGGPMAGQIELLTQQPLQEGRQVANVAQSQIAATTQSTQAGRQVEQDGGARRLVQQDSRYARHGQSNRQAASQQATARLQKLLITVNFRADAPQAAERQARPADAASLKAQQQVQPAGKQ